MRLSPLPTQVERRIDYFEARHEESDNDDDYDDDDEPVEICDKKRFDGDEVEYLVRWKDGEETWESFGVHDDCDDLIREYEKNRPYDEADTEDLEYVAENILGGNLSIVVPYNVPSENAATHLKSWFTSLEKKMKCAGIRSQSLKRKVLSSNLPHSVAKLVQPWIDAPDDEMTLTPYLHLKSNIITELKPTDLNGDGYNWEESEDCDSYND